MIITAHVPDEIAKEAKKMAKTQRVSVSHLITESLSRYISEKRKVKAGMKLLGLAGKLSVSSATDLEIEGGRVDAGRP